MYTIYIIVGVVGSNGDLGSQLKKRLIKSGVTVRCFDRSEGSGRTIESLYEECDIVHFCIPIDSFDRSIEQTSALTVLHDSVMSTSSRSLPKFVGPVAVVHMLMNEADMVVIANESESKRTVKEHFASLGYTTHEMQIADHDKLMAQSQAPFALLIRSLHEPLHDYNGQNLLTPSGKLLMETLDKRVLAWTPETIHSILKNPMLEQVLKEMNEDYARHNRS